MKIVLYIVFIAAVSIAGYGFYLQSNHNAMFPKYIGLGVAIFFFLWMPLFIYHRYKGKDIKDYMITDDIIKKIKEEDDTFIEHKKKD